MNLLKFIDSKLTASEQSWHLKTYMFIGAPLGCITVEVSKYFFISTYKFNILTLILTFIIDLLIATPFIINYFKHKKKYDRIVKKIQDNPKLNRVKALFNYRNFIKNESYELKSFLFDNKKNKTIYIDSGNNLYSYYTLKDNINKFDLDDIKEERLQKLKKINKLYGRK